MSTMRFILLGLAAYTACASLASADPDQWQGSSTADSYAEHGPEVTVVGGPQHDHVTFDFSDGQYVVVDRPALAAGHNCSVVDHVTVRCDRFALPDWPDRFVAFLGGGNDTFHMLLPWRPGFVDGQGGNDKLIGSAAPSDLSVEPARTYSEAREAMTGSTGSPATTGSTAEPGTTVSTRPTTTATG